jgi:hypothetical protein
MMAAMSRSAIMAALLSLAAVTAQASAADASLRAELELVAQRRIYFGHQSVGANLLDGVKQLAEIAGVPLRIVEIPSASALGAATFGHTLVAENGDPLRKLDSFRTAMGPGGTTVDIALLKFCYVDITADTDAKALFERYRATIEELRAKNPRSTFVHVTLPLTDVQGGPKALVKRMLGRAPYGTVENLRREEYNALMRDAYRGREPLFDLALLESTAPDGTAVKVRWNGAVAPAMSASYTDDGGHLNAAGKLRAARELVSVLAAIPAR